MIRPRNQERAVRRKRRLVDHTVQQMLRPIQWSRQWYWRPDVLQTTCRNMCELFLDGAKNVIDVAQFISEHLDHLFVPARTHPALVPSEDYLPSTTDERDDQAVRTRDLQNQELDI